MAFDAYLKFEGGPTIKGESIREGHKDEIEIYSFSFGAANHATIDGGTHGSASGKGSVTEFNITKTTDSTSPILFQACMKGDHFPKAKVTLNKSGGDSAVPFLIYEFEEVYITSLNWSGAGGGDDRPMEGLSFAFGQVTVTYSAQSTSGSAADQIIGKWNVRTQTAT